MLSLWSMGVNQSSEGTATVAGIINLHLATAQIGRAGTGPVGRHGRCRRRRQPSDDDPGPTRGNR